MVLLLQKVECGKWHQKLSALPLQQRQGGKMANFKGHALPGSFFLLFGLWWSVKFPLKQCWRKGRPKGRDRLPQFFIRIDLVEGGLKIFFAFVGECFGPPSKSDRPIPRQSFVRASFDTAQILKLHFTEVISWFLREKTLVKLLPERQAGFYRIEQHNLLPGLQWGGIGLVC